MSLSTLINSMSKNNFTYNYLALFNQVPFEDQLKIYLPIFVEEGFEKMAVRLRETIENVNRGMGLELASKIISYKNWTNLQELVAIVHSQHHERMNMYLILHSKPSKNEREGY